MAFSNSLLARTVFGNLSVQAYSCVADGLSGTVVTGFNSVRFVQATPISLTTGALKISINELTSGTAAAGTIAITGVANGDEFFLTAYGS